jgi:hypothetical protein
VTAVEAAAAAAVPAEAAPATPERAAGSAAKITNIAQLPSI